MPPRLKCFGIVPDCVCVQHKSVWLILFRLASQMVSHTAVCLYPRYHCSLQPFTLTERQTGRQTDTCHSHHRPLLARYNNMTSDSQVHSALSSHGKTGEAVFMERLRQTGSERRTECPSNMAMKTLFWVTRTHTVPFWWMTVGLGYPSERIDGNVSTGISLVYPRKWYN